MATTFISAVFDFGFASLTDLPFSIFGHGGVADDFPADGTLSSASDAPSCDWNPMPGNLIVDGMAVRGWSGAGGGTENAPVDTQLQIFTGLPGVNAGSSLVIPAGQNKAHGSTSVTIASPSVVGDLSTTAFGLHMKQNSASVNTTDGGACIKYHLASPYDKYNIIGAGFGSDTCFDDPNYRTIYPTFNSNFADNGGANPSPEANQNQCIGIAGTFKYLLVVLLSHGNQNDATITAGLRVNGSTVISTTHANNAFKILMKEQATSAHVTATDKCNFYLHTDNGTATFPNYSTVAYWAIGFLPD